MGWVGRALVFVIMVGCGGEAAEPASRPTSGVDEPVAVGPAVVVPEPEAEPESPPDPHPVVAGFVRELRAWASESEAAALDGIELTGTAGGETDELTERIRHVFLRELAGPAILRLQIPEIERYGEDIRAMPEGPEGPEPEDDDDEPMFGGWGMGPHANIDGMGNVVGDLHGMCDSGLSEVERERRPNPCDERFVPVWATVKLALMAYFPIEVATMGFVDPGTPMGDGEWDRADPMAMRDLLALAERAGLERQLVMDVAVQLLRDLVAAASPLEE